MSYLEVEGDTSAITSWSGHDPNPFLVGGYGSLTSAIEEDNTVYIMAAGKMIWEDPRHNELNIGIEFSKSPLLQRS